VPVLGEPLEFFGRSRRELDIKGRGMFYFAQEIVLVTVASAAHRVLLSDRRDL